ncbi:TPA: tetratricopeptide repeat protein, partial [Mannheimia haemolytica]|nr:tetratricopeptide repeat protein [Mannheimia haemolytica]
MKKIALLALFPMMLFARDPNTTQAYIEHTAQPTTTPQRVKIEKSVPIFNETELRANQLLTEKLLIQAIYSRRLANMEKLTAIYRDFTHIDPVLLRYAQGKIALLKGDYAQAIQHFQTILAKQPKLNTVRIELAIALLYDQQLNQAQAQFEKAKSAEHLPPKVHALIEQYQQHLAKKQEWKFSFSANYVRDGNINRTSKQPNIEQTGYVKQPNLL